MPIGVMADALSVALGGLTGAVCCKRISEEMKEKLTLIFGLCSMGIGISSIVCMKNLPAVVLAMVAGTALGVVLRIGRKIEWACGGMQKMLNPNAEENGLLVTAMVLFCASGTGIYCDSAIESDSGLLHRDDLCLHAWTDYRDDCSAAIRDFDGCFYDCEGIGRGDQRKGGR